MLEKGKPPACNQEKIFNCFSFEENFLMDFFGEREKGVSEKVEPSHVCLRGGNFHISERFTKDKLYVGNIKFILCT